MKEKIVIQADPDTQDLVPGYLEKRQQDVAVLKDAMNKQNYESIQGLGHRMKGTGEAYGFLGITQAGAEIEGGAKSKNNALIEKGIENLADYLERVEVVYDAK